MNMIFDTTDMISEFWCVFVIFLYGNSILLIMFGLTKASLVMGSLLKFVCLAHKNPCLLRIEDLALNEIP